ECPPIPRVVPEVGGEASISAGRSALTRRCCWRGTSRESGTASEVWPARRSRRRSRSMQRIWSSEQGRDTAGIGCANRVTAAHIGRHWLHHGGRRPNRSNWSRVDLSDNESRKRRDSNRVWGV